MNLACCGTLVCRWKHWLTTSCCTALIRSRSSLESSHSHSQCCNITVLMSFCGRWSASLIKKHHPGVFDDSICVCESHQMWQVSLLHFSWLGTKKCFRWTKAAGRTLQFWMETSDIYVLKILMWFFIFFLTWAKIKELLKTLKGAKFTHVKNKCCTLNKDKGKSGPRNVKL